MTEDNATGLDWQSYEEITKYIYQMLGKRYGIKIRSYGTKSWITGKSGVKHQVDILTEQPIGNQLLLTAIECKFLKTKVTKEVVMKLSEIMRDGEIASGVIVTTIGFTRDTLTFAEHRGIKLVELRESSQKSEQVEIATLDLNIHSNLQRPEIVSIDLGTIQITDQEELFRLRFPGEAYIRSPEGKRIPLDLIVNTFCKEVGRQEQLLKTITLNFPNISGTLIRSYTEVTVNVEKMVISGILSKSEEKVKKSIQIVDQVWMIMKEIFEKSTFTMTKGGFIYKASQSSE